MTRGCRIPKALLEKARKEELLGKTRGTSGVSRRTMQKYFGPKREGGTDRTKNFRRQWSVDPLETGLILFLRLCDFPYDSIGYAVGRTTQTAVARCHAHLAGKDFLARQGINLRLPTGPRRKISA